MMKKVWLSLFAVCVGFNAYGEGVVLSDTAVDDDSIAEESISTYNNSSSGSDYKQITIEDILARDTSDPLFLTADNHLLSDTFLYFA